MVDSVKSGAASAAPKVFEFNPRHIDLKALPDALAGNERLSGKVVHDADGGLSIHLSSRGEGHPLTAAWHKLTGRRHLQNQAAARLLEGAVKQARKSIELGPDRDTPAAIKASSIANALLAVLRARIDSGADLKAAEVRDALTHVFSAAQAADDAMLARATPENVSLRAAVDQCFDGNAAHDSAPGVNAFMDDWISDRVAGRSTRIQVLANAINRRDMDIGCKIHPQDADQQLQASAVELTEAADELAKAIKQDAGLLATLTSSFHRSGDTTVGPGTLGAPVAQLVGRTSLLQSSLEEDSGQRGSVDRFQKRANEMVNSTRSLIGQLVRIAETTRDRDLLLRVAQRHQALLMRIGSSAERVARAAMNPGSSTGLMLRLCQLSQDVAFASRTRDSIDQRLSAPRVAPPADTPKPEESRDKPAASRTSTTIKERRRQATAAGKLLGQAQIAARRFEAAPGVEAARAALADQARRAEWRVNRAAVRTNANAIAQAALTDWTTTHAGRRQDIAQMIDRLEANGLIATDASDAMRAFLASLDGQGDSASPDLAIANPQGLASFRKTWNDNIVNGGFLDGRGATAYRTMDEVVKIIQTFQLDAPQ